MFKANLSDKYNAILKKMIFLVILLFFKNQKQQYNECNESDLA